MRRLFSMLLATAFAAAQAIQSGNATKQSSALQKSALPPHARALLDSAETRYTTPGKERLTLNGLVTDSRGNTNVKVTLELPNSARYEETSGPGKSVVFDGSKSAASVNPGDSEYDLLESLYADSADYYFYSLSTGSANRFLGNRFRTDDGKNPAYAGPWLSITELVTPLQFRSDKAVRQKFYLFDTATKLLTSVRYELRKGATATPVEVKLSGHTKVDGHMVPGTVIRYEGGQQTLQYRIINAAFSPKAADAAFTKP